MDVANFRLVHELLGQLYKLNKPWTPSIVPAILMRELVIAVEERKVTGTNAKAIFKFLLDNPSSRSLHLEDILEELEIAPADSFDLEAACRAAIEALPAVAKDVQAGQMKAIGRLIGDVMKRSGGAADAKRAKEVVLDLLGVK